VKELKVFLYGDLVNNAILRIPDRKYPGVLIQGDTLENLLETSGFVAKLAREKVGGELAEEAENLFESLSEIYKWYRREWSAAE
jgi:hypothetical protein